MCEGEAACTRYNRSPIYPHREIVFRPRLCKDAIRQHNNNLLSIKFTKQLIHVRKSHAEYAAYMEQQKVEMLKKREAEEAAFDIANAKKIKLDEKINKLQQKGKKNLSDQNAAQKLLNKASSKLMKAINENNMSEVKIAQMMLSAANSEKLSVNSRLTECCSKQDELKLKKK